MTTTAKPRRVRYEVLPSTKAEVAEGAARWKVTRDGTIIATRATKHGEGGALELATITARSAWRTTGQLSELVIKAKHGRITDTRTYGRDPTSTKG